MPGPPAAATLQTHRPGTSIRRRRLRTAAVASLLLTVLVAGPACSDDEPDAPTAGDTLPDPTTTDPEPTTADPTTTTTTPPTPEEEVEAAYLDITKTYFRRLENPDPADPSIARNHTGDSKRIIEAELDQLSMAGQIGRFPTGAAPKPSIISVELTGADEAVLQLCLVDDTQIVETVGQKVVNDDVSSRLVKTSLVRQHARWKVESLYLLKRWEDGNGCDR